MKSKKAVRQKTGGARPRSLIERINPNAAGIDCGSAEHFVAVPTDRDPMSVRSFKTFTGDLERLADWLIQCGVTTVAMESTGVYWLPVYEIIEARGIEAVLVNAQHVKGVPGRKSDVVDCEWLREIHSVGLVRGSFRPEANIASLRTYMRHRETLIQSAVTTMNRIGKGLILMNFQLHLVISDLAGLTGMRILRDIVAGVRDPKRLAQHRDRRCKATEADLIGALTGHYRDEHLFVLRQNLEIYDAIQKQITDCDLQIEKYLALLNAHVAPPPTPLPKPRSRRKPAQNEPRLDLRQPLFHLTGVDLSQVDAIGPYNALRIIAEIGTDMSRWRTPAHFVSWVSLAPRNQISGGKLLKSSTQPSANRVAIILRMAAMSLSRTETALGAFYRRLSYRIGAAKAITATARKLALLIYRHLKGDIVYKDPGATAYDQMRRKAVLRNLTERARNLGFCLVPDENSRAIAPVVS
jgi:transposase